MIESIDEFVLEYPEEISAHILSMRFDSLAYLESRTPTDEFKFVDHETPTHGEHPTVILGYFHTMVLIHSLPNPV